MQKFSQKRKTQRVRRRGNRNILDMMAPTGKDAQFSEIDTKDIKDGRTRRDSPPDIFISSGDAISSKLDINRYDCRLFIAVYNNSVH